jgi:hypothetical protein
LDSSDHHGSPLHVVDLSTDQYSVIVVSFDLAAFEMSPNPMFGHEKDLVQVLSYLVVQKLRMLEMRMKVEREYLF